MLTAEAGLAPITSTTTATSREPSAPWGFALMGVGEEGDSAKRVRPSPGHPGVNAHAPVQISPLAPSIVMTAPFCRTMSASSSVESRHTVRQLLV